MAATMSVTVTRPKVSVVMSLYNSERYLKEAIDSVLSQTLTDFEFIIIDDGSKDSSVSIVDSYHDSRIHLIKQKNAGLAAALNKAISVAKSDCIARMDPDDICMADRLVTQYDYLQAHPEVVVLGSAAMCIDQEGQSLAAIIKAPIHQQGMLLVPESPCVHPSVMFRRAVYQSVGGYPERMRYGGEDAVLFNKMLIHGAIVNLPNQLLFYRVHPSSMSQKSKKFNRLLREMIVREVKNKFIAERDWDALAKAYDASNINDYGYYCYLGKLFLTQYGKEKIARKYFYHALCTSPLSLLLWLYWLSTYIPFTWREQIKTYTQSIKNRNDS